jgi:ketosteroid isomerase-like protein
MAGAAVCYNETMKKAAAMFALLLLYPVVARASQDAVAIVLETERAWLDAYETYDVEVMQRVVADGFAITYQDGNSQTKTDIVAWLEKAKASGRKGSTITTEGTKAHVFGNHTIVLRGVVITERTDKEGKRTVVRSQYTDTWVLLDGRWQVASSHLTVLP